MLRRKIVRCWEGGTLSRLDLDNTVNSLADTINSVEGTILPFLFCKRRQELVRLSVVLPDWEVGLWMTVRCLWVAVLCV